MTNASAMTLSLLVFLALFLAAMFVILWGGTLLVRRDRSRAVRHPEDQHRRAA
ncbi:MAG: hypothetical protein ACXVZR_08680 [Terriglobales bacterium]